MAFCDAQSTSEIHEKVMKLILFKFLIENRKSGRLTLGSRNILQQAFDAPHSTHSEKLVNLYCKATFFGGFYLMNTSLLNKSVPSL